MVSFTPPTLISSAISIAPGLHGLQEQMIQKLCDDARKGFTGQSFPNTSQNPQAKNEQDAGDSAKSGV